MRLVNSRLDRSIENMRSALIPMQYILFLVLAILVGCSSGGQNKKQQSDLQQKLSAAIEKKGQSGEQVVIQMKSLTDFEWDRFYVFDPYSSDDEVRDTLGFDTTIMAHSRIKHTDTHNLLVFVQNKQVEVFIDYPRSAGDFDKLKRRDGYNPAEANFEVKIEGVLLDGNPLLRLYQTVTP